MTALETHAAPNAMAGLLVLYGRAVHDKDLEAFASLYAPDVRVFDAWGRWVYEGRDAWCVMARAWFDSLPAGERVAVLAERIVVTSASDLAVAHGFMVYRALSAEGKVLRSLANRFTWIAGKREGQWRVMHEHGSLPLDFETKAMLRSDRAGESG